MRILYLSHFYPPEIGGASARIHGLCKWHVNSGHDVTVITAFPNYPSGKIDRQYRWKLWQKTEHDGVKLCHTWVYATPKKGMLRTLLNNFSFVISSMIAGVCSRKSYDVIVVTSPPLFLGLSGWLVSIIRRTPWIMDIRDIWPDVAIEGGQLQADSRLVRLAKRLELFLYRRATHITVVTDAKRDNIARKLADSGKISVVENGVDLDVFDEVLRHPDAGSQFRFEHHLEDKFLVSYAGVFGAFQGLDVVLRAAKQLASHKNIHFVLVGEGSKRDQLIDYAKQHDLQNVTFLPLQPREKVLPLLATSDAMLVPLVSAQVADAVPSKLLEAWGCRKGVVFIGSGEAKALVERCDGGVVVEPGSPRDLVTALLAMNDGTIDYSQWGDRGHQFVKQHFERSLLAKKMESVCDQLKRAA